MAHPQFYATVLGIMQDAGLPHIGCRCARCRAAFADPGRQQCTASLAVVNGRQQPPAVWLIDATPDLPRQLSLLANVLGPHSQRPERLRQPSGVFLTHAHMGHTLGLAYLGPEGMSVRGLPVLAPVPLLAVLRRTLLWQPTVRSFDLRPLPLDQPLQLAPELTITPLPVPHRDELNSGTVAYLLQGPQSSLLYLPDIDAWEQWPAGKQIFPAVDVALVDATFWSVDELVGRPPVAHPLVPETLRLWAGVPGRLVLTHLNHTNPLLDENGPERAQVLAAGAEVAYTGQRFPL